MNIETKIGLTIAIVILTIASLKVGQLYERGRILNVCTEKNHEVYNNKSILRCQVLDINVILSTKYWGI